MLTLPYRKVCVIDLAFGGVIILTCIVLAGSPPLTACFAALAFGLGVVASRLGDNLRIGMLGLVASSEGTMSVARLAMLWLLQLAVVVSLTAMAGDTIVAAAISAVLAGSTANGLRT